MPGYGIGMTSSASGVATCRNGAMAAAPASGSPSKTNMMASVGWKWTSAGMNGAGGAAIRNEMVVSSSGALAAMGWRPAGPRGSPA